jgi:hypothetical protein
MPSIPIFPAQQDLMAFPLRAVNEYPPRQLTADAAGEVEAIDGLRYHVKGDQKGQAVCASEWLCTKIAEEVGIAGPNPAVIQMLDGRLVFGSRRISGTADQIITTAFLTTRSQPNLQTPVAGLCRILSNIYTFDMFIYNVDRHFGNYLSTEDSGARRLYAMDYSRALFWGWPFSDFPGRHENTRICGTRLRQLHGFDETSAFGLLDQLNSLAPAIVEGFINRMPPAWMPESLRFAFMGWWLNGGRVDRLTSLRMGIGNGQLL